MILLKTILQVWQRNLDLVKSISPRQRVETNTALQVRDAALYLSQAVSNWECIESYWN